VRSYGFIIAYVAIQNTNEVCLVQNQEMIETFLTNRSYPPFGKGICIRRMDWRVNDMKTGRLENIAQAFVNLLSLS